MGNSIFDLVVGELEEYMGDIWSVGIVKKGVKMVGASPSDVTEDEMREALSKHIIPAASSFVSKDKAKQLHKQILKTLLESVETEVD
jgi:hypothetical protein